MSSTTLELALMALALLAGGAATGLLAGLFGVGGGAVIVPVLYEVFRLVGVPDTVRMPLCIGTSLAVIIPTAISSYRKHLSKGLVDQEILKLWILPVLLGVILGSLIASVAPPVLFKAVFITVMTLSAVRLLFGNDTWRLAETLPGKAVLRLYGVMIGLLSSLMGIGGGQFCSLFMLLYGRSIHQAISTSAGVGVLIAIPGAVGYAIAGWSAMPLLPPGSLGFVSLVAVACIIPASVVTAPIGAAWAHRLSRRKLEIAFGLFLLVICVRFLVSALAGW